MHGHQNNLGYCIHDRAFALRAQYPSARAGLVHPAAGFVRSELALVPASQASLSYAEVEVAMTDLMRTLSEPEQARFAAAMADLAAAPPAEACWASRRLYALIEAAHALHDLERIEWMVGRAAEPKGPTCGAHDDAS
jgi:hypothetical protein